MCEFHGPLLCDGHMIVFVGDDKSLLERLEELQKRFDAVGELTNQTDHLTDRTAHSTSQGIGNVTLAEETIEKAFESFKVSCFD
jgi:hypothetical protein